MRRSRGRAWPLALAALGTACAQALGQTVSPMETIDAANALAHVRRLSDDAWRGRGTPSPGLDSAAGYVARWYGRWGFEARGDTGFIQRVPLLMLRRRVEAAWRVGETFRPMQVAVNIVLAEPPAGEGTWPVRVASNDSLPRDAAGSVVVFPPSTAAGEGMLARVAAARRAGAAAVLTVVPDEVVPRIAAALAANEHESPWTVALPPRPLLVGWLAASAWRAVAPSARDGRLAWRLRVRVDTAARAWAPNVIAYLPGRDPQLRHEVVVLSAHLDHVGVGPPVDDDSIYNGADDNASGTAALLEIAKAFAALSPELRPRRSLLFLHVSGEELGLLGSQWFVAHPPVPLAAIVADLNIDIIGRNAPDTVVVVGKPFSTLGATIDSVAAAYPGLRLRPIDDPWPQEQLFLRSDHFSFAQHGIPAVFFFGGFHADYHRPSDEADRIDADKLARVARLVFAVARAVADADARPRWNLRAWEQVRLLTGNNEP